MKTIHIGMAGMALTALLVAGEGCTSTREADRSLAEAQKMLAQSQARMDAAKSREQQEEARKRLEGGSTPLSLDESMALNGYRRATREEMLRPVTPTFPVPKAKPVIKSLPKEKLAGKWTCTTMSASRHALLTQGYDGPISTNASRQTWCLFKDGRAQFGPKFPGKWNYHDDMLTITTTNNATGKVYNYDYQLLWYGENEFELKHPDLSKYENMLHVENIKSVKCRYEPTGVLHTEMIMSVVADGKENETAIFIAQNPMIYVREGPVE